MRLLSVDVPRGLVRLTWRPVVVLLLLLGPVLAARAERPSAMKLFPEETVVFIRAAHAGRATLSPEAAQALVESANQPPAPGLDLTEREREVLSLMIEGLNNTQIAGRLTVSPSTIKSHVSNILSKLGVASRTEAVALALRSGIVPPPW